MRIPPWINRLPLIDGKRTVIIDNNVFSSYLFDAVTPDDVRFLFEDAGVRLQCGRQVIDEALNHPGLDVARRQVAWESLSRLQASGKLVLSGGSQMTPTMTTIYTDLARHLTLARLSAADARVFADAIVKRIPVFTLDDRARNALVGALNNPTVRQYLAGHGLPGTPAEILAG